MATHHASHHASTGGGTAPARAGRDWNWKQRLILGGITLIAAVLVYLAMTSLVPRWWAQRIGRAVNGQLTTGMFLGVCIGLMFTAVPLAVLWLALRGKKSWKARGLWALLAAVLALPNLWTLGVSIGTGNGSHAGQRTMDVDAPLFRGSTLVGALLGAALFITVLVMLRRRRAPRTPKAHRAPKGSQAPQGPGSAGV